MNRSPRWRWLLLMYPPDLRRDHGDEILFAVAQSWRDQRGVGARLRWLAHVVADFVRSWPRARRSPLTARPLPPLERGPRLGSVIDDVKAAARMFRHAPGFAAGAIVTLSLGIGASAAIFSLADATLLRPLPVPEPHRILQLTWSSSHPDFRDISAQQAVFSVTAAWASRDVGLEIEGRTVSVRATAVAGDYFGIAGARPAFGRLLTDRDNDPGAPLAAVLSDRAWQRLFGSDPSITGRTVRVNQHPIQIVGVASLPFRGFTLAESPDVFVPLGTMAQLATDFFARMADGPDLLANRGVVFLQMIGRLRPGMTQAQAEQEVERLYRQLHPPRDASPPTERLTLTPLTARAVGLDRGDDLRRFVRVLGGATLLTLLLACVSVAGLLLVRAEGRQRELGVRAALGAGRWRMIRLLLVESLAIGLCGAGLGTAVAYVCVSVLGAYSLPGAIAIGDLGLTVNSTVLMVSVALGMLTSVVFGLAPLGAVVRADAISALRASTRVTARQPLRSTLVAAQVLLCVLLFGGGLAFARAVQHAFSIDFGFDTTNTAIVTANPSLVRYSRDQVVTYQRQALDRLRGVPWVSAAAWANMRPLRGRMTAQMNAEGAPLLPERERNLDANAVTDGYFEALGIPVLAGRTFQPTDATSSPRVAVLSASAAAKLFPAGNALGSRVTSDPEAKAPVWITIVGIIGDIKRGLERQPDPMIYTPLSQTLWTLDLGPIYLFVRSTAMPAEQAAGETAALLTQIDPAVAITAQQTIRDHVGATAMTHRLGLTLFTLFAALAAILTTFGVYAVVASAIAKRTREIGIRMALGAHAPGVLRLVVTQGLPPVVTGLAAGTIAFWWFGGALSRFLLTVPAFDVVTMAAMVGGILLITVIAMLVPARRAMSIDPALTLRSE
jgi:predicted permease